MAGKPFEAQITKQQREAAARARADAGLTGPEIVERAAAGRLTLNGEPVPPFTITQDYVRKLAGNLVMERQGKRASPLSKMRPDDAIEALRVRLINMADAEMCALERQKVGKRDLVKMRDIVRATKEAASIRPPSTNPPAPGGGRSSGSARPPTGERSENGMTGALLHAHRKAGDGEHARRNEAVEQG